MNGDNICSINDYIKIHYFWRIMIKHQQSKEGVTKSYELGPERQLYHTNGSDLATRGLV